METFIHDCYKQRTCSKSMLMAPEWGYPDVTHSHKIITCTVTNTLTSPLSDTLSCNTVGIRNPNNEYRTKFEIRTNFRTGHKRPNAFENGTNLSRFRMAFQYRTNMSGFRMASLDRFIKKRVIKNILFMPKRSRLASIRKPDKYVRFSNGKTRLD